MTLPLSRSVRPTPRRSGGDPEKLVFLRLHGAHERGHSHGSLLKHLQGTASILRTWGERQAVVDAGLFHSVYGTEVDRDVSVPPELRPEVRAAIGDEAESLAWLFGIIERRGLLANVDRSPADYAATHRETQATIALTDAEVRDLATLEVANALEQLPRLPAVYQERSRALGRYEPWLPAAAIGALRAYFAALPVA